jgi:2-dehydropantoate 2-reductase
VVIGAGAIGAPIAAQLYERGHPVVLVARGANYDAIASDGVSVVTPEWTRRSKVDVVNGIAALTLERSDVVVLCVKSQDTVGALDELLSIASKETPVLCAQNGVANERLVRQRYTTPTACASCHRRRIWNRDASRSFPHHSLVSLTSAGGRLE